MESKPFMALLTRILAAIFLTTILSGCGHINPPVVQQYGVPIYQPGSGLTGNMSPEEAGLVRGRVEMEELRHNQLREDFNYNRSREEITYPPE
jgi:hypothetical protein